MDEKTVNERLDEMVKLENDLRSAQMDFEFKKGKFQEASIKFMHDLTGKKDPTLVDLLKASRPVKND